MGAVNTLRKFSIYFLLTAVAAVLFVLPVSAEGKKQELSGAMRFTMPDGYEYQTDIIAERRKIYDENGIEAGTYKQYSFVLPYNAQKGEITLLFSNIDKLYKDGKEYLNGGSYLIEEGEYTALSRNEEYNLIVKYTSDIAQLYLTLDDGWTAIEKEKGVEAGGSAVVTDGITTDYRGRIDYIRCRGNSSFLLSKKSYNIKLSSKTDLLGGGASKKYAVMPFYFDFSSVREPLSAMTGKLAGIEYCMEGRFVDLYINGEYRGIYYLTEKVEVAPERINILDLDDVNAQLNPGLDMETATVMGDTGESSYLVKGGYKWVDIPNAMADGLGGGYLLEYDLGKRYDEEKSGFVSEYGQPVVVKSPGYATKGQVEYIREYYQQFEDALLSDSGYNSLGRHYSEYIDMESFARMYVFQEYALNLDAAMSSAFMYKDVNGKLTMCTVWDIDHGFGYNDTINGVDLRDPRAIWATVSTQRRKEEKCIFTLLCQHADFRRLAAECWEENFAPNVSAVIEEAQRLENLIYDSAYSNQLRWIPDRGGIEIFTDENMWLREFLSLRAEFMSEFMNTEAAYVVYKRNGGSGVMIDKYSYMPGDAATVLESEFTADGAQFIGWNTKADGSGISYQPGDTVQMKDGDAVLYAQWDGPVNNEEAAGGTDAASGFFAAIVKWFKNIFSS